MAQAIRPITWDTQLVDPETGRPTQTFIDIWQQVVKLSLSGLFDVNITNPTNGQVLTYSSSQGKWIAS